MGPGGEAGGREKERERRGERQVCTLSPRSARCPGTLSLIGAGLHGDPTPPPTQPLCRGKLRPPGLPYPPPPQSKERASAARALPAPAWPGWAGMAGAVGRRWDRVTACGAVRLHVEEVLDALRADRALALVLLGDRLLLGPGEMHLLGGRLHLVAGGLGTAGEGGGVFVVDELDLQRGEGNGGQGPGPAACPSPVPAQRLTSSSGFSSPSPTCSSGTLRRRRVLAGFLRRMEPRDSSVMLWICAGQGQPGEQGRRGLGRADPSLQPRLRHRMSVQSHGAARPVAQPPRGPDPTQAVLHPHLPLPLILGEVHLLEDLGALLHH